MNKIRKYNKSLKFEIQNYYKRWIQLMLVYLEIYLKLMMKVIFLIEVNLINDRI